jgi:hypothetical protein
LPSGDHAGDEGYLIREMRSMVMLPRGVSAPAGVASRRIVATHSVADENLMVEDYLPDGGPGI